MANFAENVSLYLGIPICITSVTFPPTKQFLPNFFAPYNPKSAHFYFVSFSAFLGNHFPNYFFRLPIRFFAQFCGYSFLKNLTRGHSDPPKRRLLQKNQLFRPVFKFAQRARGIYRPYVPRPLRNRQKRQRKIRCLER